jgi:GGDEF domain-containing protein
MTGRLNRASGLLAQPMLLRLLDHEAAQAQRHNTPMAVIRLALQLDGGLDEAATRAAHQILAQILNSQLRAVDLPGHLEDEYLIIMPITTEAGGRALAARLARAFAGHDLAVPLKPALCAGLAGHPGGPACNADALADQATAALRAAQRLGSNIVVSYSDLAQA